METDKLEVTKPIKLTTIDPKNFIRVTPSNEARLMRKAERIKKEREKTFQRCNHNRTNIHDLLHDDIFLKIEPVFRRRKRMLKKLEIYLKKK